VSIRNAGIAVAKSLCKKKKRFIIYAKQATILEKILGRVF